MDDNGGMTGTDWAQLIMLGDQEAMRWWSLTHDNAPLPSYPSGGQIAIPGMQATFNPNLLIVGLVIVAAIVLMK